MSVKPLRPRKLIASAILAGAAASAITANAGHAFADPDANPPVVGEAQSQARQPGSGGSQSQPGLPGQSHTPRSSDSTQPGLPKSGDAGSVDDDSATGPSAQPGMPTSPKSAPRSPAPKAPAPQRGSTGDNNAPTAPAPVPRSVPTAPAGNTPSEPSVVPAAPAPKPKPPTFEQKLQRTQPVDFPQVTEPQTGTSQLVAPQQWCLSGTPQSGPYMTVPAHLAPVVTHQSTPLIEDGHKVGSIDRTTVGPHVSSSTSSRVQPDQVVSAGVIKAQGNRVGIAQQAHKNGTVQAAAATSGGQAGYGSGYVSNTPHPASGGGSTTAAHGQWQLPGQGITVKASGKTSFKSMEIPKVSGVVNIKTPWGNFNTPPIK